MNYLSSVFKSINSHLNTEPVTVPKEDNNNYKISVNQQSVKLSKYQPIIEQNVKANHKHFKKSLKTLHSDIFFSAKIKVMKRQDPYKFTIHDIIYFQNKAINLTNSIIFYLNNYFNKEKFFIFPTQDTNNKPISIEEQNNQCYICLKTFNYFLGIPTKKINWCSYYMRYVCSDCISDELSIIPAFILTNWNFGKYSISKFAKEIINLWENKPVIHIKAKNPILGLSSLLKQAITMKRKIHKIYDLMKCSGSESFIVNVLESYKYLVFKENYFSLHDLCGINDFTFIAKLHDFFKIFENHILTECDKCHYLGGICFICNKDQMLYAYNVESTIYCPDCKKIFHKKCSTFHPCLVERRY